MGFRGFRGLGLRSCLSVVRGGGVPLHFPTRGAAVQGRSLGFGVSGLGFFGNRVWHKAIAEP